MTVFANADHVPFCTGGQFVVEDIESPSTAFFTDGQFGVKVRSAPIRRPAVSFAGGGGGGAYRVPISQPLLWERRPWEEEILEEERRRPRRRRWRRVPREIEPGPAPPPLIFFQSPPLSGPVQTPTNWRSIAIGVSIGLLAGFLFYEVYRSWKEKDRRRRSAKRKSKHGSRRKRRSR